MSKRSTTTAPTHREADSDQPIHYLRAELSPDVKVYSEATLPANVPAILNVPTPADRIEIYVSRAHPIEVVVRTVITLMEAAREPVA